MTCGRLSMFPMPGNQSNRFLLNIYTRMVKSAYEEKNIEEHGKDIVATLSQHSTFPFCLVNKRCILSLSFMYAENKWYFYGNLLV